MSVPASLRSASGFQVIDNISAICTRIIILTNSNFGLAVKEESKETGNWKVVTETIMGKENKLYEEDSKEKKTHTINISASLTSKRTNVDGDCVILELERGGAVYLQNHKTWLIDHYKEDLWKSAQALSRHVRIANDINPVLVEEYKERRLNQDLALSDCRVLLDLIQQCSYVLHTRPSKTEPLVDLLSQEIHLIIGWRKADYKKLQGCMKNEGRVRLQAVESLKKDLTKKIKSKNGAQNSKEMLDILTHEIERLKSCINEYFCEFPENHQNL